MRGGGGAHRAGRLRDRWHGSWPPSARRGSSRSSKRRRSMMLCCPRSSPRTSWTSASRPGPASRSWGRRPARRRRSRPRPRRSSTTSRRTRACWRTSSATTAPKLKDYVYLETSCPRTCAARSRAELLMKDPVITADGTTFERCAIKEWFETGARTSPTTNRRWRTWVIPNHHAGVTHHRAPRGTRGCVRLAPYLLLPCLLR